MEYQGVPPSRIHVIRNGIDVEKYSRGDRSLFRNFLGLDTHQPLIGTIALLRPRKGIEYLLRAIRIVTKLIPEARCVIVGDAADAHYGNALRKLCEELDIVTKVQFVAFRDDIPNILSAMDVFVLPSLFGEGLPLVILEAMAAAKPVIATPVEGTKEAIVEGDTGIYVPPGNHEAIAKALIELISNPNRRDAMGQRGRQIVLAQFNGARMTEQAEKLYYDVWLRGRHG
jgi:glycosyltransferase involved in cell wall biosynthesis